MITDAMTLVTKSDAERWAASLLEGSTMADGSEYGDDCVERLAQWLWKNFHGKSYGEVEHLIPVDDAFYDLVEGVNEPEINVRRETVTQFTPMSLG